MPIPSFFEQGPDGTLQVAALRGPEPSFADKLVISDVSSPGLRDFHSAQSNRNNASTSKRSSHYQNNFQRWHPGQSRVHNRLSQQEPWEQCRKLASGYDTDMCRSWKAEIDNLLICVSWSSC
ncbi:hypothetical protein CPB84DRAFT_1774496 [Gymnopilus junonius]|uniref:Uncharacterized protein n=1 Tax=Gymnopilus junonius TaxID=109634 RepID=A0A9P5NTG7_GYMJU|nr:hypothetical protein CPB84DRAFT_1774496 [Gymnopilus junonius]